MSKSFAVFDIDGTIFRSSLYLEIVYELAQQGTLEWPEGKAHIEAYERWLSREHSQAYVDYVSTIVEILESNMTGMAVKDFEKAADVVVKRKAKHTYVYTRDLIQQLKVKDYFIIAISGSQVELVERFAKRWDFDDFIGARYERKEGRFTGKIQIKTHKGKERLLAQVVEKHGLKHKGSIAVGDSMGDVGLFESVEQPIAFNPDRRLRELATERGWRIVVERKSVVYELEPKDGSYILA